MLHTFAVSSYTRYTVGQTIDTHYGTGTSTSYQVGSTIIF